MYEIIDSHTHIFPMKIANKATISIGGFYGIKMENQLATAEELLKQGKNAGISRFVVHSSATAVEQVEAINKFIIGETKKHAEFIGYMTLHPDMDEAKIVSEIDFCMQNGIKGIKLHPDFQKFYIDSDNAKKIYRSASGKLPILFHTGDWRYDYSSPLRLAHVAKEFPNLTVIGAHFGGFSRWAEIDCYKGLDNVYFDTSSTLAFMNADYAVKLIHEYGVEKFFFGTDFPMWKPEEELERFMKLNLTESERKKILAENYKKVFNIK